MLDRHIGRGTALVAVNADQAGLLGGLLFSAKPPAYHVRWLVVSKLVRRQGVGRALVTEAMRRFVSGPGVVELVTSGAGHPRARLPRPSGSPPAGARGLRVLAGFRHAV